MDKIDKLVEKYVDNEHSVKAAVARRRVSSRNIGTKKKKKKYQNSQESSPKE